MSKNQYFLLLPLIFGFVIMTFDTSDNTVYVIRKFRLSKDLLRVFNISRGFPSLSTITMCLAAI